MSAHKVDEMGHPLDPELRKLEFHLCDLAGTWRGSWGDPQLQEETVREFHATMAKLYSLGWDGTLDIECELPEELLPEEYLKRRPRPSFDIWQWPRKKSGKE